jgi:hypothetical protein
VASDEPEAPPKSIIVPDVTGELWKRVVETSEIPQQWMDSLNEADGAIIFLRVHSEQNVEPLNWVTCGELLQMHGAPDPEQETAIPTQVALCELLRYLEIGLGTREDGSAPRVSVVVTAWDLLDEQTAARGPKRFIDAEYPMFAGRIADSTEISVKIFGASVVSGDFTDDVFKERFFETELKKSGYVVVETETGPEERPDMTLPVAWILNG